MSSNIREVTKYEINFKNSFATKHPARITFRGNMYHWAGALCMLSDITLPLAPVLITLGIRDDFIDGPYAREYGLSTIQGANIDPLADKLGHLPEALIIANDALSRGDDLTAYLMAGTIATNIFTQFIRGNFPIGQFKEYYNAVIDPMSQTLDEIDTKNKANWFGKVKAATQTISNGVYASYMAATAYNIFGQNQELVDTFVHYAMPTALTFCIASASLNIASRFMPKKTLEDLIDFPKKLFSKS